MTTTYGILSDFHTVDPRLAVVAMNILKEQGAQKLILNGDLAGERYCAHAKTCNNAQCNHPKGLDEDHYIAFLLNGAAATGLETYVQPGSHEELDHFEPPMQGLAARYGNLHNAFQYPKIEADDHHVVFLPGSDVIAGNAVGKGYQLLRGEMESAFYKTKQGTTLRITNMEDLKKDVTDPDKTIVISHIPARFETSTAVDRAEYGIAPFPFTLQGRIIEAGSIYSSPDAKQLIESQYPVQLRQENRGNVDLRDVYNELGITKAISGHFHESVHQAHDWEGRALPQGEYNEDLFWNASYMDGLKGGLLSMQDEKVVYQNVDFREFLRQSQE